MVMREGKCKRMQDIDTDPFSAAQKKAKKQLRKEHYFRYRWTRNSPFQTEDHRSGYQHHLHIIPRRYPHKSLADVGDNYIGVTPGNEDDDYVADDRYIDATRGLRSHTPRLLKPFSGAHDMDLTHPFWTPRGANKFLKPVIQVIDAGAHPNFSPAAMFASKLVPLKSFLGQQANKKETQFGHHSRVDRFIPLKKKKDVAYASGLEAGLLQGSEGAKLDPLGLGLPDKLVPVKDVMQDMDADFYNHVQFGDPISDALHTKWDLHDGVTYRNTHSFADKRQLAGTPQLHAVRKPVTRAEAEEAAFKASLWSDEGWA